MGSVINDITRKAKDDITEFAQGLTGLDANDAWNAALAAKGALSVSTGSKGFYDSRELGSHTSAWSDGLAKIRSEAGNNVVSGAKVNYTPGMVDFMANLYSKHVPAASSKRIIGVRAGMLDNIVKSVPDAAGIGYEIAKATAGSPTNPFSTGDGKKVLGRLGAIGDRGTAVTMLADTVDKGEKGIAELRGKLLDNVLADSKSIPLSVKDEMNMALHKMPKAEYDLLHGGSWSDRAAAIDKAIKDSGGKTGTAARDFMTKYILGTPGSKTPSLGSLLAEGDVQLGRSEIGKGLMGRLARQATIGKYLHGTNAVLGVGTLGYALNNLINSLNSKMKVVGTMGKAASFTDADTKDRVLEGAGGSVATGAGLATLRDTIKALKRSQKPVYDIGFTYGDMPGVGEGHKAPAMNIRAILERGLESLPEGHWGKKIKGHNVGVHGPGSIDAAAAKNLNVLYNGGLGIAPAAFVPPYLDKDEFNAARKFFGNVDTIKNYVTDIPYNGSWGAAVPPVSVKAPAGTTMETLAYGPPAERASNSHLGFKGVLKNLAPEAIGTPFLHPNVVDNAMKYNTKELKISRLDEIADKMLGDKDKYIQAQGQNIKDIINHMRQGKRVVTISGSGRGDYVANRLAHVLDSADRAAIANGDLMVVPMFGRYSGMKNVTPEMSHQVAGHIQSTDPRIRAFGRLAGDPYTLLQGVSDINFTTTGQMGVSENAISPNIQAIPKKWNDGWVNSGPDGAGYANSERWMFDEWLDMLRKGTGRKDLTLGDLTGGGKPGAVQLDMWNAGQLATLPKDSPNVFKQIDTYDKANRRYGVEEYLKRFGLSDKTISNMDQRFDTDPLVNLLKNENAGELSRLTELARGEAKKNLEQIPKAHKALLEDMLQTVQRNNAKRVVSPLRVAGGAAGGGLMTGLGLAGMYDALFGKGRQLKSMLS